MSDAERINDADEPAGRGELPEVALTERQLNIPKAYARKYASDAATIEELESVGNLALVRAYHNFDRSKGKLNTHLIGWVRWYMLGHLSMKRNDHEFRWSQVARLDDCDPKHYSVPHDDTGGGGVSPEDIEFLQDALGTLKPLVREAFVLYATGDNRSFEEVGRLLKVNGTTARKYYLRAKRQLWCYATQVQFHRSVSKGDTMPTRKPMPDKRRSHTVKVVIEGQTFYLTCGEYADGSLGEIFINANKTGTFVQGVLDGFARMVSRSLQYGIPVGEVVKSFQLLNFPPNGSVTGSSVVSQATSVYDWVAQEISAVYCSGHPLPLTNREPAPDKPAGYLPEEWRSGI